jgi:hypothetical protein
MRGKIPLNLFLGVIYIDSIPKNNTTFNMKKKNIPSLALPLTYQNGTTANKNCKLCVLIQSSIYSIYPKTNQYGPAIHV